MDKISERLGALTSIEPIERQIITINSEMKDLKSDLEEDKELARSNIKELIVSSMDLIPNLMSVVRESESARMYESASNFIKMVAELNTSLLEVSKASNKGDSRDLKVNDQTVNNTAVFIGTGDEVFKQLSRRNDVV